MRDALEAYYTGYLRARRNLRKQFKDKKAEYDRCKGEHWCTTRGHLYKKNVGRELPVYTLDKYCNAEACMYYPTKPEATPPSLLNAIAAAEDLRERANRLLMPPTNELTALEVAAYLAACDAQDLVDSEDGDEGGGVLKPELPPKGTHSGFAHWFEDD